jgi:Ca2+-transporting ATPase
MNVVGRHPAADAGGRRSPSISAGGGARVEVIHRVVPGRVRFRIVRIGGAGPLAATLAPAVAKIPGVLAVEAGVWTGTLLVRFGPGLTVDRLCRAIATLADDTMASPRPVRPAPTTGDPDHAAAGPDESPPWHTLARDETARRLRTSARRGLAAAEAAARLQRFGANRLARPSRHSRLAMLFGQFDSLPVALLAGSAVISLMTGGAIDALVVLGVIAVNAGIGFATENQAASTIEALTAPTDASVRVVRDGAVRRVPVEDVVPGDLHVLEPGSIVAADARVTSAHDLTVDESALTGESLPVRKTVAGLASADVPLADRTNMIYRGTAATGGSGLGLVVATGAATEIGRIQSAMASVAPPPTPMAAELHRLGTRLAWFSGGVCGLVFLIGLLRGQPLLPMLKTAVSLAVAAVPEGLPTIATTTLALGIRDMRRRNVLVRRFDAVETLGAVQVVCFDKTGTLTLNRMTVVTVGCDGRRLRVADGRLFDRDRPTAGGAERRTVRRLLRVAALCNETTIAHDGGRAVLDGSPTEAALVRCALDAGLNVGALRRRFPAIATRRRTERQSFMATTHVVGRDRRLIAVKGSPGAVLALCRWQDRGGARVPLSADEARVIALDNERMAGEALRVLGFAYASCDPPADGEAAGEAADGLTWLGLVGLADPTRPGMKALMRTFHDAGITTIMITGDQSTTAYAVARELGLSADGRIEILDSVRLEDLAPEVLSALAQRAHVFSRVTPSHKLQIVQALQRAAKVVAMTGDGINDGPALRVADIGLAMGAAGTDVARDVADVILADDDPTTIATAIARGRVIFENIRKALRFLLATNMSEIVVAFTGTAAGLGQPLTPMQLLWINLLTDVFPALALALEPAEVDVMKAPPHAAGEAILRAIELRRIGTEGLAISLGALAAGAWGHLRYGPSARAETLTFLSLISAQLLHAVSCRSERAGLFHGRRPPPNRLLTLSLIASFGAQGLAYGVPPLRRLLGLVPIGPFDAAVAAACAVAPFVVNEAVKARQADPPRTSGPSIQGTARP